MSAYLWISDVLKLFPDQQSIDDFTQFKSITILGTIVNIQCVPNLESANDRRPIIYEIDDGTSVIKMVYFVQDKVIKQKEIGLESLSSTTLSKMVEKVQRTCFIQGPLEIGETVEVKGFPQLFNGSTEMKAFRLRSVSNPNEEVDRMFLVSQLRKSELYSNLFLSKR